MSVWEIMGWANAAVAADEARELALTVPQEAWPKDGSFPVAAHVLLYVHPETGKRVVKWTGTAYGGAVTCVTEGVADPVRVKPAVEMLGGVPALHLRLVDDEGYTRAHFVHRLDYP